MPETHVHRLVDTGIATAAQTAEGVGLTKQDNFTPPNGQANKKGIYALEDADLFNLLCIPPYKDGDVEPDLVSDAAVYCEHRRAMLLVDPPTGWIDVASAKAGVGGVGTSSKNAALFFPRLKQRNLQRDNQTEEFVPCGAVAGVFARTDTTRGVWKAPANVSLNAVVQPTVAIATDEQEDLNTDLTGKSINAIRSFIGQGVLVWGARTLDGNSAEIAAAIVEALG